MCWCDIKSIRADLNANVDRGRPIFGGKIIDLVKFVRGPTYEFKGPEFLLHRETYLEGHPMEMVLNVI
jgi:hypothetical protein